VVAERGKSEAEIVVCFEQSGIENEGAFVGFDRGGGAFLWSVRSGQFEDLDGAAQRILVNDDRPLDEEETDAPTGH
jgi:cbb3-type cytochrome oxidase maturation protein